MKERCMCVLLYIFSSVNLYIIFSANKLISFYSYICIISYIVSQIQFSYSALQSNIIYYPSAQAGLESKCSFKTQAKCSDGIKSNNTSRKYQHFLCEDTTVNNYYIQKRNRILEVRVGGYFTSHRPQRALCKL